jgi:hypothetical protein
MEYFYSFYRFINRRGRKGGAEIAKIWFIVHKLGMYSQIEFCHHLSHAALQEAAILSDQ